MQARSNRSGMGTGRRGGRVSARAGATSLLGLWATINHARVASSLSSGTSCPTESIICAADEVCSVCIDSLRSLSASSLSFGSTSSVDCDDLVFDLCSVVEETVCDYSNEKFTALAECTLEDATGCAGFTSCTDVLDGPSPAPLDSVLVEDASSGVPTGSPTTGVTSTESPGAATTAAPSGLEEVDEASAASSGVGFAVSAATHTVGVALIFAVGLVLAV